MSDEELLRCGFCGRLHGSVKQPGGLCLNCQAEIDAERKRWEQPGEPATGETKIEIK
jgi:hypothetical protein